MAKLGEGDQRWIVKERDDGTNCNGWHWSEKNLTEWSKERLGELLGDIVVFEDSTGSCKVTELEKMTGDVTVQSRKQKKFPLYELELTLKWEGQLFDAEARLPPTQTPRARPTAAGLSPSRRAAAAQGKTKVEAKGKVKIPDLSEETYDDLEMTVTLEEESNEKRPLKESVRLKGAPLIRQACMAFVKELKARRPSAARCSSTMHARRCAAAVPPARAWPAAPRLLRCGRRMWA